MSIGTTFELNDVRLCKSGTKVSMLCRLARRANSLLFSVAHKAQFLEYYATVGFLLPQAPSVLHGRYHGAWALSVPTQNTWSGDTSLFRRPSTLLQAEPE